jgi:hypothetical protein
MDRLRRWIVRRIDASLENTRRKELAHGPREVMHGVPVVAFKDDAKRTRALLDRARAALDLVARHDPRALAGIVDHFDHIQVICTLGPSNAQYVHAERRCLLSAEYLERPGTEPARLAMTLVHELTHARHISRGKGADLSLAQAEWLCIGAELAFARKVPGTEHLRQAARKRLERRTDFYARPAEREREADFIHAQKLPRWVVWMMERMAGRTLPPPPEPPAGTR